MALAADLLGDRWTLLILREAFYGVQRYDDLLNDLGISRSMLSSRLRTMTQNGLLESFDYREDSDRTRRGYRLSAAGWALVPVMMSLAEWGEDHLLGREGPVVFRDKVSGETVRVGMVTTSGMQVRWQNIRLSKPKSSDPS